MPRFDDQRHNLERWVGWLDSGKIPTVRRAIAKELPGLLRVHGSERHRRLAEFLQYAGLALETGETPGSRYILQMALTAFGWSG